MPEITQLAQGLDLGGAFKLRGDSTLRSTFSGGLRGFISAILPNAFLFAGLILFLLIIAGGIGMIINSANPEAQQKSKGLITNAVIGFLLIIASYWLIQIIQTLTGVNILGSS